MLCIDPRPLRHEEWLLLQVYQCFLGSHVAFKEGYWQVGQFLMRAAKKYIQRQVGHHSRSQSLKLCLVFGGFRHRHDTRLSCISRGISLFSLSRHDRIDCTFQKVPFPVSIHEMDLQEGRLVRQHNHTAAQVILSRLTESTLVDEHIRQEAKGLLQEIKNNESENKTSGPLQNDSSDRIVITAASRIPCRPLGDQLQVSAVTGKVISGPSVQVQGNGEALSLSLSEAILVSRVTRYSGLDILSTFQ